MSFNAESSHLDSAGRASPAVEMKIVNASGVTLEKNKVGEIAIRGDTIMKGYLNNHLATSNVLDNGWLLTGDLGRLDKDGYLFLHGRKDDVINIGGLSVSPIEVESILSGYESIIEACVVAIDSRSEILSKEIKAFIVTDKQNICLESLKKFCLDKLEPYKIPHVFELVDDLPKTSSGKLKRNLLSRKLIQ